MSFYEKQHFRQWWLWLLMIGIDGVFIYGLIEQIVLKRPFGTQPMSNISLIITSFVIIMLSFLILSARLDTKINKNGIYVRFYPFHLQFQYYPWSALKKSYIRKYAPLKEFGGWGLRLGLFGRGRAFNVSGNNGLQLEFSDEKRLLIGTQKPEKLRKVLLNLGRVKKE